jgi:hypothetical protein
MSTAATGTTASLRELLAGVIDYAGLFPPASLPLDQSIRNYARYRNDPESWMLGRFICPTTKLSELLPFVRELFADGPPLAISALGRPTKSFVEVIPAFGEDLKAIAEFRAAAGERAVIEVLELRLPEVIRDLLPRLLDSIVFLSEQARLRPFCEVGFDASWKNTLPNVVQVMSQRRLVGYKLRSGGVEAKAFPSPEQVALAIATCRDARVPIKFTAGLHHPIRHHNDSVQTKMHGFINVFAAATIANAHRQVDAKQAQAILEDESAASFSFDENSLKWRSLEVTTSQIEAARREFAISFGSCSFDEPREDLRNLRWLSN